MYSICSFSCKISYDFFVYRKWYSKQSVNNDVNIYFLLSYFENCNHSWCFFLLHFSYFNCQQKVFSKLESFAKYCYNVDINAAKFLR
jgi:hypothetical protein